MFTKKSFRFFISETLHLGLFFFIIFTLLFFSNFFLSKSWSANYAEALTDANSMEIHGAVSKDNLYLTYISDVSGTIDLYVRKIDNEGSPIRLTNDAAIENDPVFSPDGKYIAFSSNASENSSFSIYIVKSDGSSQPRRITDDIANQGNPSYSHDNRYIAYATDAAGTSDIYKIESFGNGAPIEVIVDINSNEDPCFSSDGRYIAFQSNRNDGNMEIYLRDNSSGIYRVTNDAGRDRSTCFSPDSKYVAFVSDRGGSGVDNIWVRELFRDSPPFQIIATDQDDTSPFWLERGDQLVFTHMDNSNPADTNLNIWLLHTSKNISSLEDEVNTLFPVISPDKNYLAFVSDQSGSNELYIVSLTIDQNPTGSYIKLTSGSASVENPTWNSDSSKIAFSREVAGEHNIWIIDVDGNNLRPVTANYRGAYEPDWNHTSDEIIFRSFKNGYENLYTVRISDNAVRQITFNIEKGSHLYANPCWNQADPDQIAFDRSDNGNSDIYIMKRDLTGLFRLTNSPSIEWNPCFSHDGKRIFYNSNRRSYDDIYSISNTNSVEDSLVYENGYLRLFNNTFDNHISISPDSNDIYFSRYFNNSWRIYRCQSLYYMNPVKWSDRNLKEQALFNLIDSKR